MNDTRKTLASARYRAIATLVEVRRRGKRTWRDVNGPWSVIPQTYGHVHPSAGEYVLTRWSHEIKRSTAVCSLHLQIPTEAGRVFRFDVGHHSDLKPATVPR